MLLFIYLYLPSPNLLIPSPLFFLLFSLNLPSLCSNLYLSLAFSLDMPLSQLLYSLLILLTSRTLSTPIIFSIIFSLSYYLILSPVFALHLFVPLPCIFLSLWVNHSLYTPFLLTSSRSLPLFIQISLFSFSPHLLFEFFSFPPLISVLFYLLLSLCSSLSFYLYFVSVFFSHPLTLSSSLLASISPSLCCAPSFCPFPSLYVSRCHTQSVSVLLSLNSSQSLSLYFQYSFFL